MFRWYQNAEVCYVYLSDVGGEDRDHHLEGSSFRRSEWFTRGWTLQELLAPSLLIFFNQSWVEIGTKSTLGQVVKLITGIDSFDDFADQCVAKKMSWAAERETTRSEDMAYCLMGIFGVNMSLLYGEGETAFIRLQTEIMKTTSDETIFAWVGAPPPRKSGNGSSTPTGLLASSPRAFKQSGNIRKCTQKSSYTPLLPCDAWRPPFEMTNNCLHISLFLLPADKIFEDELRSIFVDTLQTGGPVKNAMSIFLLC
jgi:hypothetical protein